MRKKIFGILFSLLLFAPATCTFMWLQHKKSLIKHEVKEKILQSIDKSQLVMFRFSDWELANKLKWEHDLEFEYEGTMYDIVERTKEGNITQMWCWPDKKETRLNKAINKISDNILGKDKKNQQHQVQLNNFFKTLFNPSQSAWYSVLPNPATIIFKPVINIATTTWNFPPERPPAG